MFTVQNVLFKFNELPENLFYQIQGDDFEKFISDNGLNIKSHKREVTIKFLGIFNTFPAEHFFLNTKAKNVFLKLNVKGNVSSLKVFKKTLWNTDIVHKMENADLNGEILLGPFDLENGIKRYSFEISTRSNVTINCAEWAVEDEIVSKKTVDLSITTFKKEKYVTNNVNLALSYKPLNSLPYRTIVVDNGNTLLKSNFINSERFVLISQDNLGGTGGFMRGLLEARRNETDYILFMDDDILLCPEIIFRAVAIAQISKEKKAYGGMMLHYTKKDKIHEQGGRLPWEVNRFFTAINDGDYLSNLENNSQYDSLYSEGNPDFSGWWFYMAEVKDTPILPNYFFKWDDICSSLYLQKNGVHLSVFPTIFVWHEDFSIKRHLFMTDYLSMRNEIHTFAFLDIPEKQMKVSFERTFQLIARDILMWDYNRAKIRLKALKDALNYKELLDPQFVIAGNGSYPVSLGREFTPKLQEVSNDIDIYFEKEQGSLPRGSKKYFKLLLSLGRLVLPFKKSKLKNGKTPLLSMDNGNFTIVYKYKEYFLYNPDGHIGYYCKFSLKETIGLFSELIKTISKVKKEYPSIVQYFKDTKFDENYWEKIFNHQETKDI